MQKIILAFIMLTVSLYGQHSFARLRDEVLSRPALRETGLFALYTDFCLRGYALPTANIQFKCAKLSSEVMTSLDVTSVWILRNGIQQAFTVAFRSDLLKLANDPLSHQVLQSIDFDLMFARQNFNLYDSVYKILKNHRETLRWVAVMVQDTSTVMTHVAYLKQIKKPNPILAISIQGLEKLASELNQYEQMNDASYFSSQQLYPPSTQKHSKGFGWRLYHFYLSAYLANQMLAQGLSRQDAAFGASQMNFAYEAVTREGHKLEYPLRFEKLQPSREKAYDIYGGYLGACYGIGRTNCIQNVSDFRSLVTDDALATIPYFRKLLTTIQ